MRTFLLLTLLLPSIARASDWTPFFFTDDSKALYDKESVVNNDGNVKVWVKFSYYKMQKGTASTDKKPFDTMLTQFHIACEARQYEGVQYLWYHKGEVVGSWHPRYTLGNLEDPPPDSLAMGMIDTVCPKQSKNAKPESGANESPDSQAGQGDEQSPGNAPAAP